MGNGLEAIVERQKQAICVSATKISGPRTLGSTGSVNAIHVATLVGNWDFLGAYDIRPIATREKTANSHLGQRILYMLDWGGIRTARATWQLGKMQCVLGQWSIPT